MKVILDPVYTGRATTCSTVYLMWKIAEQLISQRDDVFFYLLVPERLMGDPEQLEFLHSRKDRIKPVPYPGTHLDRMKEHWSFSSELWDLFQPANSELWDVDVILTSRMQQIAMMRFNSGRSMAFGKGLTRQIIGLEEMPMYDFSQTVLWSRSGLLDPVSAANVLAADAVVVSSLWAKQEMLQSMRQVLAPSKVREAAALIHEAIPISLEDLDLKTHEQVGAVTSTAGLNVAFCGRITGTRNFKAVAELFRKQFSYPLGKGQMKFVVSTNSQGSGSSNYGDLSVIDFEYNSREQFHEFLTERAHVAVNLSTVEDFSLSTYEPLKMGVPMIVADRPWSDFLGKDYPFRVKNEVEAYAWINAFAKDYAKTYELFEDWHEAYWKPLVRSSVNRSTPELVSRLIHEFEEGLREHLGTREVGMTYRAMIQEAWDSGAETLDLTAMLQGAGMLAPVDVGRGAVVAKIPVFQLIKALAVLQGFVDTQEPGVLRRPLPVAV